MSGDEVADKIQERYEVVAKADAVCFEINSDGTMGRPVLDDEGMEYINECVSEHPSDIEVGCRHCHYRFSVHEHENGGGGLKISE